MKKLSLSIALSIAALVVYALPLHAAEKSGHFFGTVDYFLAGDVGDDLETEDRDIAAELTASGNPTTSETDVSNGVGGRIGYLRDLNPHFSLGGSVGYIVGPKIESKLNYLPGGVAGVQGYFNSEIKTSYLRILTEGVGKYPLNEKVSLNLGVGLGVAAAQSTQKFSGFLTDGISTFSAEDEFDECDIGFTWEVSPSIQWNLEKIAVLLGMRYAQFPKIKGNESHGTYEIDWKGLGFFAGMQF